MNKTNYPPILKKRLLLAAPFFLIILFVSAAEFKMETSEMQSKVTDQTTVTNVTTYYPTSTDNFILITPPARFRKFINYTIQRSGCQSQRGRFKYIIIHKDI